MEITIVSGCQWGDEGKGKISYYLSQFSDICMRVGGGSNAESTFYHEGKSWHFQMLPSGIVRKKIAILGDGILINCAQLILEIQKLEEKYENISNYLMISGNAHIVLPYHIKKDTLLDESILKIKTIRQGIGPAIADRAYRIGINVDDFIKAKGEPNNYNEYWNNRKQYVEILKKYRKNTKQYLSELKKINKKILIQGTQGFMLDNIHGTYPFVTSSYTSSMGLLHGAGLPYSKVSRNIGIAKAYVTRFSVGGFPTECSKKIQEKIRNIGKEFAHTSNTPLRIGWLDFVALKYAQEINNYTEFCITKLDVLSELKEIPVCIGYLYHGKIMNTFYEWSNIDILNKIEPIYKILKGWQSSIRGIQRFEQLPIEAQNYITFFEYQTGVKVSLISTGPKDEEIIIKN